MACQGCRVQIAVVSGSDLSISVAWVPALGAGDGTCEQASDGSPCVADNPCRFLGRLTMTHAPEQTIETWTLRARTLNTPIGEDVSTSYHHPGWGPIAVTRDIGTDPVIESLCEGLKNPLSATNGYEVTVSRSSEPAGPVWTGHLYCEPCANA